jgi:ribosomal protein S27AE
MVRRAHGASVAIVGGIKLARSRSARSLPRIQICRRNFTKITIRFHAHTIPAHPPFMSDTRLHRSKARRKDDAVSLSLCRAGDFSMTSSGDRCPTCDGSGFVARGDQRYPCPTCSPSSSASGPYLAADPDDRSALHIARSAACGLGAAALIAVLALVLKALWH